MNGKKKIATEYGEKTVVGIADLIDRETGAGELLEACRAMEKANTPETIDAAYTLIRAAIAKVEGK